MDATTITAERLARNLSAISAEPALRGSEPYLVGSMNVVPHAEGAPVLCHHHVAVRHPLDVRAVVQEGPSCLRPEVVPVFVVYLLR